MKILVVVDSRRRQVIEPWSFDPKERSESFRSSLLRRRASPQQRRRQVRCPGVVAENLPICKRGGD